MVEIKETEENGVVAVTTSNPPSVVRTLSDTRSQVLGMTSVTSSKFTSAMRRRSP